MRERAVALGAHGEAELKAVVFLAVLLAVAARLAAQLLLGFYQHPEVWEEGEIAARLAAGGPYVYEQNGAPSYALRAPAYAFALAAAYVIFGTSPLVAGAFQALLGGVLAAAVFAIGMRVGGPAVTVIAALGVATHPGLLVYSAKIHQLSLDALLAAVGALLLLRVATTGVGDGARFGALLGLAALTRPTFLPFLLLGGLLAAVRLRLRRLAPVLAAVAVSVAIVAPWLAHNALTAGSLTLSTDTGYLLWIGNNPMASGTTVTADGRAILDAAPEMSERVWGRPEAEQDRLFREAALQYMAEDTWRTLRDYATKAFYFWWFSPQTGTFYPPAWLTAYHLYYALTLVSAILGAILLARSGGFFQLAIIAGGPLLVSLSQSIFYVDGRHRWGVESLLLVLSAAAIVGLSTQLVRRLGRH